MEDQYKKPEGEQPQAVVPDRDTEIDDSATPIQIQYKDKDPFTAQQEFVDHYVEGEFTKWDSWRKPWENLWNECYKLYLNISELMKTPTRARIFIPAVFQVIEAAIPKLMTLIFGDNEFFDVLASNPKEQPFADAIKKLLKYQVAKADFFLKFIDFAKQLLMYGTSYLYVYWKVERRWVHKRVPIRGPKMFLGFKVSDNAIIGWKEEKVYEVVERRPEVEVLDVLDVYPDPEARSEKDSRAIWVRSWMDLAEVKELGAGRYPVFDPQNVLRIEHGTKNTLSESRQVRNSMRGLQTGYADSNQVEILTRWGLCDLDGDGIREETLIVIANRKYLLRAMPNPFDHQRRPILKSTLFPVPLEWFGIGLIEPIIPLQHELNTIRRQRLDNVNLILNRMWKVNSFADIDMETLVSSPNGVILTDDMNAVEALETANVTQDAYNEAAMIQNDIDNATAPKSVQGTPSGGSLGRTAKGAQLIIGQALEKFGTATKLAEESGIKRMLRMMLQLNEQFIDTDEALSDQTGYGKLFANLDFPVTPEIIRTDVQFQMKGISEMINSEGKINQIVSFMGVFGPMVSPETMSFLMKDMWKLMGRDTDEVDMVAVPPVPGAAGPMTDLRQETGQGAADVAQIQQNGKMTAFPGVPSTKG